MVAKCKLPALHLIYTISLDYRPRFTILKLREELYWGNEMTIIERLEHIIETTGMCEEYARKLLLAEDREELEADELYEGDHD